MDFLQGHKNDYSAWDLAASKKEEPQEESKEEEAKEDDFLEELVAEMKSDQEDI